MKRREFILTAAGGVGAVWLGQHWLTRQSILNALADTSLPRKYAASDTVTLGTTGIKTSRLAMGTGTVGYAKHSNQTALGIGGLSGLLLNGYDHGLRFFDAADSYGSHPHVAAALKQLPRDKVTIMTKSPSRTPQEMRADLDRYRKELGTDYLDIVLMHCVTEGDWTSQFRGAMDVLSEAKQKGIIRAHGCSCHTIEALRAAAKSPWVEVDLVRTNPIGSHMDADPETVAAVIREMRAAGKGIIGMKILGQGDMRNRQDDALKYALSMGLVDAFTIGAENKAEQMDLIARIGRAA